MQIDTKKVTGRRKVRYESLDDLLRDAERLAQQPVRTLGNWSQGQIYEHLARSLDSSIDGVDFKLPAPMRWMLTLLMKRKFLYREIPPGFQSPTTNTLSEGTTSEQGLASLRSAIQRQQTESHRELHPAFGKLGCEGWDLFHLRHAEMHMGFLVPAESPATAESSAKPALSR